MSPTPTTALTTSSSSASAARTGVRAVATFWFWHAITGSLLATHWRLRVFPTGEDPHATVRKLRRRTKSRRPQPAG